ncbi:MAG: spore cortex biosynthesis protein YabQ [Oscillospiraceae bacterium]|nr:spore cortex biosynthesis protein YabQ [Oscillospiraceae bacterium]
MRIALDAQLRALGASVLLGLGLALVYDLLRAIRLRRHTRHGFTAFWDAVYCLALAVIGFFFSLRVGDGELRIYMLLAALGAAALFFAVCSPVLRPLWDFWAATLSELLGLIRLPLKKIKIFYGKLAKISKRLFLFSKQSAIMTVNRRFLSHHPGGRMQKEAFPHGKGKRKKTRRRTHHRAHPGTAAARGAAADEHARQDLPGRE